MYYYTTNTPIGLIYIYQTDNLITDISLIKYNNEALFEKTSLIQRCILQLEEYFDGSRKIFTFDFQRHGTEFQSAIYQELYTLGYGETISYQDLGNRAGYQNASRAVGTAMNKNRLMILIPCHRVIKHNGELGEYAYGANIKKFLLNLEEENR